MSVELINKATTNDALVTTPALYRVIATVLLVVVTRRTGFIFIFFTEKYLRFIHLAVLCQIDIAYFT